MIQEKEYNCRRKDLEKVRGMRFRIYRLLSGLHRYGTLSHWDILPTQRHIRPSYN